MADLVRFGVSIPDDLLDKFDVLIAEQGYTNRSEAIRDLIRNRFVEDEWSRSAEDVVGTSGVLVSSCDVVGTTVPTSLFTPPAHPEIVP